MSSQPSLALDEFESGPLSKAYKDSYPLFYYAMSYAPLEIRIAAIRAAIAAGADPNKLDRGPLNVGRPLHYAVCDMAMIDVNQLKQNLPIVELLLEAGADPRLINRTPISRSPIKELEDWFRAYEQCHVTMSQEELGLYDFYAKALNAMKEVARRLDGECSA